MTPKEKAKDLVNKFLPVTKTYEFQTGWIDDVMDIWSNEFSNYKNRKKWHEAKKAALICVKEQLEEHSCQTLNSERHAYWNEVKTEIEAL